MITVIKNGKAKRVYCPHCESLLEYEIDDLSLGSTAENFYCYLLCPICEKEIVGDYFKGLINHSLAIKSTFAKLGECVD